MTSFAKVIKEKRIVNNLRLKDVSKDLNLDVAIVSKLERGDRQPTKQQVVAFIDYYHLNKKEILIDWLSQRILIEINGHEYVLDALYMAEESLKQLKTKDKIFVLDAEIKALLKKVDILNATLKNIETDANQKFLLQEKNAINFIFESNRIESNSLSLEETNKVINDGETILGKSMQEHLQAVNYYDAIEYVFDLVESRTVISVAVFKEIHNLLFKGIDRKSAGKFRTTEINIAGSVFKPPLPDLLQKKIEEIFEFYEINTLKLHPIILAAEMHVKLYSLYPFANGTGKIVRLFINMILLKNDLPFIIIKGDRKSRKQYFQAIDKSQIKNDNKDLQMIFCENSLEFLASQLERN